MILKWERSNRNKNTKAIKEINEKFDYKKKKVKGSTWPNPTSTKPTNFEKKFATHVTEEGSIPY